MKSTKCTIKPKLSFSINKMRKVFDPKQLGFNIENCIDLKEIEINKSTLDIIDQIILQASHEINKPQVLSNWNKLKFRIMEYFIVARYEVIGEIAAKMFGINIKILDYTQSGRKYFFEIKMTKNRKSVKFSYGPVTDSTLEAAIPSVYEILCFLIDDKEGREFGLGYRSSPLFTVDEKKYQRVNEILGDDIHGIKSLLIR